MKVLGHPLVSYFTIFSQILTLPSGLTHVSPYPDYFVAQVLNYLMVSPFMSDKSCDRHVSPWTPQGYDGWKRGNQVICYKKTSDLFFY